MAVHSIAKTGRRRASIDWEGTLIGLTLGGIAFALACGFLFAIFLGVLPQTAQWAFNLCMPYLPWVGLVGSLYFLPAGLVWVSDHDMRFLGWIILALEAIRFIFPPLFHLS